MSRSEKIQTIERDGLKFSFRNAEEFEAIYDDVFRKEEYPFVTDNRSPVILDVGAHIGVSVVYFANKYPGAHIIAFEPNPISYNLMSHNFHQNPGTTRFTGVDRAVSDKDGTLDFHFERPRPNGEKWTWGDSAAKNTWYNPKDFETRSVKTVALAPYIEGPVDLLKIDTEGTEERILRGIEPKLDLVKQIMLEFHGSSTNPDNDFDRMAGFLKRHNFSLRIKQDHEFVTEAEIKKADPYWLLVYAQNQGYPQA